MLDSLFIYYKLRFAYQFLDGIRYDLLREVGDGTFGCVWRAINKLSGEVVSMPTILFI